MKTLKITIENKVGGLPIDYNAMMGSIGFWNDQLLRNFDKLPAGIYYQDHIFDMLFLDLQALEKEGKIFAKDSPFTLGRGGSHIWIAHNGVRIILITF
tara:strand:- start:3034 stop:3327 length:294 start_codon:yes stop_codon:yes gene_type:complete